jgi:hypothetical protein
MYYDVDLLSADGSVREWWPLKIHPKEADSVYDYGEILITIAKQPIEEMPDANAPSTTSSSSSTPTLQPQHHSNATTSMAQQQQQHHHHQHQQTPSSSAVGATPTVQPSNHVTTPTHATTQAAAAVGATTSVPITSSIAGIPSASYKATKKSITGLFGRGKKKK